MFAHGRNGQGLIGGALIGTPGGLGGSAPAGSWMGLLVSAIKTFPHAHGAEETCYPTAICKPSG